MCRYRLLFIVYRCRILVDTRTDAASIAPAMSWNAATCSTSIGSIDDLIMHKTPPSTSLTSRSTAAGGLRDTEMCMPELIPGRQQQANINPGRLLAHLFPM